MNNLFGNIFQTANFDYKYSSDLFWKKNPDADLTPRHLLWCSTGYPPFDQTSKRADEKKVIIFQSSDVARTYGSFENDDT